MAEIFGYKNTKDSFVKTINRKDGLLSIIETLKSNNPRTEEREANSWLTSLPALANLLNTTKLPKDITISLEYKIPITERRIDAIITGYDKQGKAHAFIIEMKAWSSMHCKIHKDTIEFLGETYNHPCYQAFSYQQIFQDYNQAVQDRRIVLHSLAYLYNMDDISSLQGAYGIQVYGRKEEDSLIATLQNYLQIGDKGQVLSELANAPISPSLDLRRATQKILHDNFPLLDEQKIVFDAICDAIEEHQSTQKKVIVVRGDAGTGKTIIAASLLAKFGNNIQYVTPNPYIPTRWIIGDVLDKKRPGAKAQLVDIADLWNLSPFPKILLIDEAHKLETYHYDPSVNNATINSLIDIAQICVFFCDPFQITRRYDEGHIWSIEEEAVGLNADFKILDLHTQYRCNGSTKYLDWLFGVLEIDDEFSAFELEQEDYNFTICDSPSEVTRLIAKKQNEGLSARVVIGNCYDQLQTEDGNVFNDEFFDWELTDCKRPNFWAKDDKYQHTVGELFHCAGLEFDYIGVIIGPDLFYRNGKVMADSRNRNVMEDYDFRERANDSDDNWLRSEDYIARIKNLYYSLLTRGMRGCYVYFCDERLANHFRKYIKSLDL